MNPDRPLLLIEDNEDDVFFMRSALQGAGIVNPLHIVEDGEQAINYLDGRGEFSDRTRHPLPGLVLLDLKLPLKSGLEVLAWIRSQPAYASLIVLVLTSSNHPSEVAKAYQLGANSYLLKPHTPAQLLELTKSIRQYWLYHNYFDKSRPSPPSA